VRRVFSVADSFVKLVSTVRPAANLPVPDCPSSSSSVLVYRDSDKQSLPWSVFSCGIGGPAQRLCRGSRLLSDTLCVNC